MSSYIEPTNTTFDSAEQSATDLLNTTCPSIISKAGSVVRELVIRPMAYLLSWATDNATEDREKYSIAYLKQSQATENPIADAVASNYFVERKTGERSKGLITLTLNTATLRIAAGSRFSVNDIVVQTEKQYMVTNSTTTNNLDGVEYLTSIPYGNNYIVNVPVVAVETGRIEIAPGATVGVLFMSSSIVDAELTSAITGGFEAETDAELIKRAEYNTAASGIGSYYGIKKKMDNAPIDVKSLSVVAGEDNQIFRSRFNNTGINPGGFVDCYLKTAIQPATKSVSVAFTKTAYTETTATYSADITDTSVDGLYRVASVLVEAAYVTFVVEFSSRTPTMNSSEGARLSCDQKTTIRFTRSVESGAAAASTLNGTASVLYMPNMYELQQYLDRPSECFIGQSMQAKAAVPATVAVSCAYSSVSELSDADIATLKQTIADYINTLDVGTKLLNFSDLRTACKIVMPEVDLKLPCIFSCMVLLRDGGYDTFYSNSGIVDLSNLANAGCWDYNLCFFSTCTDSITIGRE